MTAPIEMVVPCHAKILIHDPAGSLFVAIMHLSAVSAPPPPLKKNPGHTYMGDLTFIKSNAPWLGVYNWSIRSAICC